MNLIHEYIEAFSLVFVIIGWSLYIMGLMSFLTMKKGQLITLSWMWRNRRMKLQRSLISACAIGMICYAYFAPETLDITSDERKDFALYLGYQLLIGGFAMFFFDMGGNMLMKRAGATGQKVNYEDDGQTVVISKEAIEKELEK